MNSQSSIPSNPGTYIVLFHAPDPRFITAGSLGRLHVRPGYYLYVGSAFGPGGLRARLSRHLESGHSRHWHVDYLRRALLPLEAWFQVQAVPTEHDWARVLARGKGTQPVFPGFGASDCRCQTHLFFSPTKPSFAAFREGLKGWPRPAVGKLSRLVRT
jgi:Uri superfamily endonuclease